MASSWTRRDTSTEPTREQALSTMKTTFGTERIMRFTGDDYECTIVNNVDRYAPSHRP